jgi:hypothetical protein
VRTKILPDSTYLKIGKTYRFQLQKVEDALRAYNTSKATKLTPTETPNPDQDL